MAGSDLEYDAPPLPDNPNHLFFFNGGFGIVVYLNDLK